MKSVLELIYPFLEKKEEYNSNNAWGFGGAMGTLYHLKSGLKVLVATACYRHIKGHKFIKVYTEDKVYCNEYNNPSGRIIAKDAIRDYFGEAQWQA